MGYVFTERDAADMEARAATSRGRKSIESQRLLMRRMLRPTPSETALDIGCGLGFRLELLADMGLGVTGFEASEALSDRAARRLGHRADLHSGVPEDLPFDDNQFTYSCLVHTLEFADDPEKVLAEALRVTKDRVFIGIVNRHSLGAALLRITAPWREDAWSHARFLTPWDVRRMVRRLAGGCTPVIWRTVCLLSWPPRWSRGKALPSKPLPLLWPNPFGHFVGITVVPKPRFRTRVLPLTPVTRPVTDTVSGLARTQEIRE